MSYNDVFVLVMAGHGMGNFSNPRGVAALPRANIEGVASVAPASLTFPTPLLRIASPAQTTVLTNIGTAPFTVSSVVSTSSDFPLTYNCPTTLAGGQY